MNSKSHNQQLANIFDSLIKTCEILPHSSLKTMNEKEINIHLLDIKDSLNILSNSFRFWENTINLLLNDSSIKEFYSNTTR